MVAPDDLVIGGLAARVNRPFGPSSDQIDAVRRAQSRRADAGAMSAPAPGAAYRGVASAHAAADGAELRGAVLAEAPQGHDGDDGDEGQEQAVLHHARATLVLDVELGLDPGLENVKVHDDSPIFGA